MQRFTLNFGQYAGTSLSRAALSVTPGKKPGQTGYPYLVWLYGQLISRRPEYPYLKPELHPGLKEELERHIHILNEFQSAAPCHACEKPDPKLIAANNEDGRLSLYCSDKPFVYCEDVFCKGAIAGPRYTFVPLGYRALTRFVSSRGAQDYSHQSMLQIAGWKPGTPMTDETASAFIDELEERNRSQGRPRRSIEACLRTAY